MTEVSKQDGVTVALLERFTKFRLPRALDIKAKVESGETLSNPDIDFLERIMEDAKEIKRYIDERPELQEIYTRGVTLYHEITKKALENEQKA